ncbi:hypothetical protein P4679_22320 [Priestia megaterium]|uniref:hypothetical protein n=1 Tax=Priestia megaterium TaxID=1404 RepID=UPI002E1D7F91|nr:hypothetical protein [Priestia megaterium]
MIKYLVTILFLGFEVKTDVVASKGTTAEEVLDLALKTLEESGFSYSGEVPSINDMEYTETF